MFSLHLILGATNGIPKSIEYTITQSNELCDDEGMIDLRDETECRDVASKIKSLIPGTKFWGTGTWLTHPKGCFFQQTLIFWNKHPTGSRCDDECKNVCRQGTLP